VGGNLTLTNALGPVSSGSTTQAVFTMSTNLWITWNWTSEYYLATSANTNGSLLADRTGWYTNATQVTIQANPGGGCSFLQWSGGVVRVEAAGAINVNGTITAAGAAGVANIGGGAGGSIYLRCSRLAGSGVIDGHGGDTANGAEASGGGGGGRIAIYRVVHSFSGTLSTNSVRGGLHTVSPERSGQYGTLVLWQMAAPGSVILMR
jgi:hypothetical protein